MTVPKHKRKYLCLAAPAESLYSISMIDRAVVCVAALYDEHEEIRSLLTAKDDHQFFGSGNDRSCVGS